MFSAVAYFSDLIQGNKNGSGEAICSVCSANELVIAAAMQQCKKTGKPLLIEATANQVNQNGGYTGMKPVDFIAYVQEIAAREAFDPSRILFGGDHLGPLVWAEEPEESAMAKAEALVAAFAAAGFSKIHLDCSMRLGSDDPNAPLDAAVVAARAARLAAVCEAARTTEVVYVIGSEVPIPGGATEHEDTLAVTTPAAMKEELEQFRLAYAAQGIEDAWDRVIAIVVQPGVEFGDDQVFLYQPEKARELTACAKSFPKIAMEGHSTDYQPAACLTAMRRDGIVILKVGPALTFAMRSAMFALEAIEQAMFSSHPEWTLSDFAAVLEEAMLAQPKNWSRHYHGDAQTLALMRKYSLSDRCRYYMDVPSVQAAQKQLFENIDSCRLPAGLLSQYLPRQFDEVVAGTLPLTARDLVCRQIGYILEMYD